jgi:hypothetical protein
VDIRFDKLHKLKLNNWTEETEAVNVRKKQPLTRGPKKSKKNQKPAQSSLRALIIGMVSHSCLLVKFTFTTLRQI